MNGNIHKRYETSLRNGFIRLFCLISMIVLSIVLNISAAGAALGYGTGDWSNGPEWWSQGQSKYSGMRGWGCLVVAQARILAKAGIASADISAFNPDVYYDWEVANDYIYPENAPAYAMNTKNYAGPKEYARQKGKELNYEGCTYTSSQDKIWENINAGKYSILRVYYYYDENGVRQTGYHYILVNNGATSELGYLRVYESLDSRNIISPGTYDLDPTYTICEILTYSADERGSEMSAGYGRELPDGDYMIASAANPAFYLDIDGPDYPAAERTNIQLWSLQVNSMVGDNDAWTIKYNKTTTDGFYQISQYRQSMCLDVEDSDTLNGRNVHLWPANQYSAQQWAISKNWVENGGPGKGYRLEARCSGYSLDIEAGTIARGTNVRQWKDNMSDAQKWLFIPYKPAQTLPEGRYILLVDKDDSYELDVAGDTGDVENGANVQLWSDDAESRYNSFDVIPVEDGYYKLIHAASGKALTVANASTESAANICLWDYTGGLGQRWAITPQRDGYMLRARCSGYAIDLEDAVLANGQNVRQLFYNGSIAQTWKFVQAEHTVTYKANGGLGAPAAQTKYYRNSLALSAQSPGRSGYTFLGWSADSKATEPEYLPGDAYNTDADLTLYAVWLDNTKENNGTLRLPEFMKTIDAQAFENISADTVFIPSGCTGIGNYAFRNSKVSRVILPAGCKLGTNVFSGCEKVYLYSTEGSYAQQYCESHTNCVFVKQR